MSTRIGEPPRSTSVPAFSGQLRRVAAAPRASPIEHVRRGLPAPLDLARLHVHRDHRVRGLDVRPRVAIARRHVHQLSLQIERRRGPDGGAGRAVILHAGGALPGGFRLRRRIGPPHDASVAGIHHHQIAAKRTAGVLRIRSRILLLRSDRHIEPPVVQFGRAGDSRERLVVQLLLPHQLAGIRIQRVEIRFEVAEIGSRPRTDHYRVAHHRFRLVHPVQAAALRVQRVDRAVVAAGVDAAARPQSAGCKPSPCSEIRTPISVAAWEPRSAVSPAAFAG